MRFDDADHHIDTLKKLGARLLEHLPSLAYTRCRTNEYFEVPSRFPLCLSEKRFG
jgi:hypothetical protein